MPHMKAWDCTNLIMIIHDTMHNITQPISFPSFWKGEGKSLG